MMKQLIMLFVMLAAMMVAGEYEIAWKQDEGASRIVSIELNGEHLAKLGGHPEWLRLYDCNGAIVPWARQQRTAAVYGEKRVDVPLQLDEVRHGDGGRLEILCHVADGKTIIPEKARLTFKTAMKDFEQQVVIKGINDNGSETTLLADGFIFESSANLELKNVDVSFAPQGYRRFRIELGAASMEYRAALRQISREWNNDLQTRLSEKQIISEQSFKIDGVLMWTMERAVVGHEPQWGEYPAEMKANGAAAGGVADYLLTPAVYPVSGIRLKCAEENYSRAVTVFHIQNGKERRLQAGTVRRFNLGTLKDESLLVFDAVNDGQLRVEIANNDNPPLSVNAIETRHPLYSLCFVGNARMSPCRLTAEVGGNEPVYDTAALLSFGKSDANIVVRPGAFSGTVIKASPHVEQPRRLPRSILVVAILLAIAAMSLALFSTLRKIGG